MANPDSTGKGITRSFEYGAAQKNLTANIGVRNGAMSSEIVDIDEKSFGFKVDGVPVAAVHVEADYSMKVHVRKLLGGTDTEVVKFDHDGYFDVGEGKALIVVGITRGPRMRMIDLSNL